MSTMNMITTACTKQKTTAPTNHKIWDGYLQMHNALLFSTVAYFKSGEKMPDVKWPQVVELKGNVKLPDFEKYIQDLTRSPNRGLMVVSLYWKKGISQVAVEDIKKVTKKYVENGRVGLAKFKAGIDLYVCPRNDTIITILAKNGFLNGKKAIIENNHSFIGCVVWRKNQINNPNSVHQKSLKKNDPIKKVSPICLPSESSRKNDPIQKVSLVHLPSESSKKNDPSASSLIHMHSESWRNYDQIPEELLSPIRLPSESSGKNYPNASSWVHMYYGPIWRNYDQIPEELLSPIRLPSESSKKNYPSASSWVHMYYGPLRNCDQIPEELLSSIRLPLESSRKNYPSTSSWVHMYDGPWRNYDQIPEELLSPIRHPIISPSE